MSNYRAKAHLIDMYLFIYKTAYDLSNKIKQKQKGTSYKIIVTVAVYHLKLNCGFTTSMHLHCEGVMYIIAISLSEYQ